MTADVSLFAALFAGTLSFLSPCVLPLVPPYIVYLTGASLERFAEREVETVVKREVVTAALLFVGGLAILGIVALGDIAIDAPEELTGETLEAISEPAISGT